MIDHRAAFVMELGGGPRGSIGAVGILVHSVHPGRRPGFSSLPGRPRARGAAPHQQEKPERARPTREIRPPPRTPQPT
ncbi:hypothetical protein ADK34_03920 [Streptomyces viridochromogenes]|uniref:Uncharacterized protein n=1 Tax=Streptomyces viridochromogenes TaxID=1938 RepID=A0A0L8LCL0_STRVR|nr:hypothetical protein ADK34_03920 [Streptomyces viridochromogenes]